MSIEKLPSFDIGVRPALLTMCIACLRRSQVAVRRRCYERAGEEKKPSAALPTLAISMESRNWNESIVE
jgi:hypothetical protein